MDETGGSDIRPGAGAGAAAVTGPTMPLSILVVDDDTDIADLLAVLLEDEGYAVRCAYDGRQALNEIAAAPVDLVLSDVMMPHVDGVTLTQLLRQRGDATPVVLTSAVYADVDIPGIVFVPKPFDLDDVVDAVNRVVEEGKL